MYRGWKDINDVLDGTGYLDYNLKEYDKMIKAVPNHEKKKYNNSHKVYERNEFIILKVYSKNKIGYIVYNTKKEWEGGHTHLNSFEMAKTIISNVIGKKKPNTSNVYLMRSHIRISNDERYQQYINDLITVKRNKTENKYYNR